jgi:hypothetical protein
MRPLAVCPRIPREAMDGHHTTRRFYGPILRMRQKSVGKKLEGRLKIS